MYKTIKKALYLTALITLGCGSSTYTYIDGNSVLKRYNDVSNDYQYVIKRPDGFTCTISDQNKSEVLISKYESEKFSLTSSAYANGAVVILMEEQRKRRKHKEKLNALTLEEKTEISNECLCILDKYLKTNQTIE